MHERAYSATLLIEILGEDPGDLETWFILMQLHQHTIFHNICFERTIEQFNVVDVDAELRPTAVILADVELQVGEMPS
jgi:hypothetical protein